MSRKQRQAMIDRDSSQLSLIRQCTLLDISRASLYYQPTLPRTEDLDLMALMDRQYLKTPFYGSRRMKAWLCGQMSTDCRRCRCHSWANRSGY